MSEKLCHCGRPLHYSNERIQAFVEHEIARRGENVPVSCGGRTWLVPRHYIALHGLKAEELHMLGFQEAPR